MLFRSLLLQHFRIRAKFKGLWRNEDVPTYRVAQEVLEQKHLWLEQGMVRLQ